MCVTLTDAILSPQGEHRGPAAGRHRQPRAAQRAAPARPRHLPRPRPLHQGGQRHPARGRAPRGRDLAQRRPAAQPPAHRQRRLLPAHRHGHAHAAHAHARLRPPPRHRPAQLLDQARAGGRAAA